MYPGSYLRILFEIFPVSLDDKQREIEAVGMNAACDEFWPPEQLSIVEGSNLMPCFTNTALERDTD